MKKWMATALALIMVFSITMNFCASQAMAADVKSAATFLGAPTKQAKAAYDTIYKKDVPADGINSDIEISGKMPIAGGMKNAKFQNALNERFQKQLNDFIKSQSDNTLKLSFSTEIYTSYEYVSVVFVSTATSASTTSKVATTVFSSTTEKIVSISDINVNGVKLANNFIKNEIAKKPDTYISNFKGITDSHNFYLYNDKFIIPFDSFEIASGDKGIMNIQMMVSAINNGTITIEKEFYVTPSPAQFKMVQLKEVLGRYENVYELGWNARNGSITINKNGKKITELTIDKNSYYLEKAATKELEAAPTIINGRTYVPLSFFEEILGIYYTVDPMGYITFSVYSEPIAK